MGLPEKWRSSSVGDREIEATYLSEGSFDLNGQPPFVDPSSVQWHIGWYNQTAPVFGQDPSALNITFLHLDADLYSSTAQVFETLAHKLHPGCFIVFDELVGYPEYQQHEMKAFFEMLQKTGRKAKVVGYSGPSILESPDEIRDFLAREGERKGY